MPSALVKILLREVGFDGKERTGYGTLPDRDMLERTNGKRVETTIRKSQPRFAGGLVRQDLMPLPERIRPRWVAGRRPEKVDRSPKYWRDHLKETYLHCGSSRSVS